MKSQYQILRDEIDYRLHSAELDGVPVERAMGDVVRLALTLAVAFNGPQRTEAEILAHLAHMRQSFPSVYGGDGFPEARGNA